ncbi:glycoside hydrolase domain-containing protein [Streptomyces sp. NPDC002668]|uniref:glycoside hydrolase domain-containing protein n=1 Tax=Streptomyces sp. NPDC002668 TaxID=3154422 RepID=UPI00332B69CB
MSKHRLSRRKRAIAWTSAGITLSVGGALTANAVVTAPTPKLPAPSLYAGRAFDTCTAPSLSAMKAWKSSNFYGAAAVYIGGKNRGCAQPQLTPSWVKSVSASGWKLIPLYVGAQPPCQTGRSPDRIAASTAASHGAKDGADAVAKATTLGMKAGSALYLDMEPYDINNPGCNNAVLTYVRAWNRAVHAKGYWAGFYGFRSTSAAAVATAKDRTDLPDIMWYALWNHTRTTTRDWPWNPSLWTKHRRAHQYWANSKETRGGVTLTVDRNDWDAPVAITAK